MTYPKIFAQQPGETSHDYTPCFLTAAAAAPPSASHPRRPTTWRNNYVFRRQPQPTAWHPQRRGVTALHWAAENGEATVVEQLISAKATVDATNDDGRGPGFSGRFGSGSGEMTEGVRTLAGDFLCFGIFWDAP